MKFGNWTNPASQIRNSKSQIGLASRAVVDPALVSRTSKS
jgi:hypothetical protein